jgi:hypothetical protein
MDNERKVIAGEILPNYKHNADTEVKMQMVLLSELYGIKKPLVVKPTEAALIDGHGFNLKR